MRHCAVMLNLILAGITSVFGGDRRFVTHERLTLGTNTSRSASVRIADIDRNGFPDVIIANGRHWPGQNLVHLNQGRSKFSVERILGLDRRTSYAAVPVDLDGDGDLDIAVGNDRAPNQIFINEGHGNFRSGTSFGAIASLRSLTVADIDHDGDQDILSTCRGMQNMLYLNDGTGEFRESRPFGTQRDSTIGVAVTDWNGDGHLDLVLANRDDQQNAILLNDGKLNFAEQILFGSDQDQTRAVVMADLNGDQHPDIVAANVGQSNRIHLANGQGGFSATIPFGAEDGASYSLSVADMDNDGDMDLIVGNVRQANAVFLNSGDGKFDSEIRFGNAADATYGVAVADLDGDGFRDIVVANSGSMNCIYLNRPAIAAPSPRGLIKGSRMPEKQETHQLLVVDETSKPAPQWEPFLGTERRNRGVSDEFPVRERWNADPDEGDPEGVLWETDVPGLGHSSPVIVGDRIFLATAIATQGIVPLRIGRGGQPDAADDNGEQRWVILCYDRHTGKEIWRRTAHQGSPRATRHEKATHANTSIAVAGDRLVAFFGSEGIHCFDTAGNHKWSRDLGIVDISKYGIGWGFASSPAILDDRIAIVCDDPSRPFVAVLQLSDGTEIWRTSRKDICERSWATPYLHSGPEKTQVVVNGWPWIVSYDFETGKEIWRIRGGGDNPVPTPFAANDWIYVTNAHGSESPIFVVRPQARGDITPPKDTGVNEAIVWSTRRGGSYMSTPVVYGDHLYLGNSNGTVRCFAARTGEKIYEARLDSGASIISSLIAADGKIFCASENGTVYVLKAGREFQILSKNSMGAPCFATPGVAEGILYFRTTRRLIAIR